MTKEQALDRLRARCSRAEYCCGQIAATLKRWKYEAASTEESQENKTLAERTEADIAEIISTLVAEKFVDDARFANAFVRDKLKFNGWGRQKILYKLKSLGVASSIIEAALQENYYSTPDRENYNSSTRGNNYTKMGNNYCNDSVCDNGKDKSVEYGYSDRLSGREVLEKLLERKWNSLKKDESLQNKKAKAVRFALSRGFDYEDVMAVVGKLSKS